MGLDKTIVVGFPSVNAAGDNPYACTGYRLPMEAEWEYAYRAGTTTQLYNGELAQVNSTVRVAWDPAGRSWAIGLRAARTAPE